MMDLSNKNLQCKLWFLLDLMLQSRVSKSPGGVEPLGYSRLLLNRFVQKLSLNHLNLMHYVLCMEEPVLTQFKVRIFL